MTTETRYVTAEELLQTPDDGLRRELVRGEVRETSPAGHEHGRTAMRFGTPLGRYVEENDLGEVYAAETGFLLARDPDTVRAPDVAFVTRERAAVVGDAPGYFPGAPDLAVEVVSPNDTYAEVEAKIGEWLDAGCRMVVVVNPSNRTVKVHRSATEVAALTVDDAIDGADVIPGWSLPVRRLFA
jgi:Uma2 family endonuclease